MAGRFGKPDATGRSSGKLSGREGKVRKPPRGEAWTWLTRELLCAPAWRAMNLDCHRLINFLMVEHCNHAGRENGRLIATHRQLVEAGILACNIKATIGACELLGLIRWHQGGRNIPSRFRLTFYADAFGNEPTHDWRAITREIAEKLTRRHPRRKPPTRTATLPKINSVASVGRGKLPRLVVAMADYRADGRA